MIPLRFGCSSSISPLHVSLSKADMLFLLLCWLHPRPPAAATQQSPPLLVWRTGSSFKMELESRALAHWYPRLILRSVLFICLSVCMNVCAYTRMHMSVRVVCVYVLSHHTNRAADKRFARSWRNTADSRFLCIVCKHCCATARHGALEGFSPFVCVLCMALLPSSC